jgi:hypothetical protein
LWNILENSRETLQHISLLMRVCNHFYNTPRLLSMQFPSLHTLKFGSWCGFITSDYEYLATFFISHSKTLEVIDIGEHYLAGENGIEPDVFPFIRIRSQIPDLAYQTHLRSFRGSAHNFLHLLNSSAQSLFARLENLELDNWDMSSDHVIDFFAQDNGQRMLTLSTLRRLCFAIYDTSLEEEEELTTNWLNWLRLLIERCQANLKILMLKLPLALDAKSLAEYLGPADSLETIYLSAQITSGCQDEPYVEELSSYCKSLRKVWLSYGKWSACKGGKGPTAFGNRKYHHFSNGDWSTKGRLIVIQKDE